MAKYHINPETQEIGACRARVKPCPFSTAEEHFRSATEAREFMEESAYLESLIENPRSHRDHLLTDAALSSSMGYSGEPPRWFSSLNEKSNEIWGEEGSIEILDRVSFNGKEIAALWEEKSTAKIDIHVIGERGYNCHRVIYKDWETGESIGDVKIGHVTVKSYKDSFGDDEWSSFRYVSDSEGRKGGSMRYNHETGEDTDLIPLVQQARTGEERLQLKRELWAKLHKTFEKAPEGFDRGQLTWGSMVNLKTEHAPYDEAKIDRDFKELQKEFDGKRELFLRSHSLPSIDYSDIRDEFRGQGLAASMYVYGARKLAERGLPLSASGVQTKYASRLWERMASHPKLPIRLGKATWSSKDYAGQYWKNAPRLLLDFRDGG